MYAARDLPADVLQCLTAEALYTCTIDRVQNACLKTSLACVFTGADKLLNHLRLHVLEQTLCEMRCCCLVCCMCLQNSSGQCAEQGKRSRQINLGQLMREEYGQRVRRPMMGL